MEILAGALIIVVCVLGLICIFLYASNCGYEDENKELKAKLENAICNKEQYLALSTHQQMQERSLKKWELEEKIKGRDKHIDELNTKLKFQYGITDAFKEALAIERIKNKELLDSLNCNANNSKGETNRTLIDIKVEKCQSCDGTYLTIKRENQKPFMKVFDLDRSDIDEYLIETIKKVAFNK